MLRAQDVNLRCQPSEADMRWIYTAVIAVLAASVLIFAVQNHESVTVSFLGLSMSAPLALLVVVIYLLGMATGGSLWALMRWAIEGSKRTVHGNV
jgi:lipopolysaccharide assembly protein A